MTQKPEITFEFEETVVLKQGGKLATEFCPRCGQTVDMLSPDVLSLVTGSSERAIFRLIEHEAIHFVESGRVVACPTCFRQHMRNTAEVAVDTDLLKLSASEFGRD